MWKVYIGQFGKICESSSQSVAESVYKRYVTLTQEKVFWQPYIRLKNDDKIIHEYYPHPPYARSLLIEKTLYDAQCCKSRS